VFVLFDKFAMSFYCLLSMDFKEMVYKFSYLSQFVMIYSMLMLVKLI